VVFDFMTKTDTKHCTKCETTKTVDQFHRDRSKKDGLQTQCKTCVKAKQKAYRAANPKEIAAKKKIYYEANREKIAEKGKRYREENHEAVQERKRIYRESNRESLAEKQRLWLAENREWRRGYICDRRANDPVFRFVDYTRARLRKILNGTRSYPEALALLGCTRQEWRDHLESQFTDGMSWDNYGEWHVDHIIPVSAFDQTDPEQQKECWNYLNTQPLWAKDNMAKGTTIPTE